MNIKRREKLSERREHEHPPKRVRAMVLVFRNIYRILPSRLTDFVGICV
jgi:hypothetical protein